MPTINRIGSVLKGDFQQAVATALRITLSVPGVHTAIAGTTKPGRWKENSDLLKTGALEPKLFQAIRSTWRAVGQADWIGQT